MPEAYRWDPYSAGAAVGRRSTNQIAHTPTAATIIRATGWGSAQTAVELREAAEG